MPKYDIDIENSIQACVQNTFLLLDSAKYCLWGIFLEISVIVR